MDDKADKAASLTLRKRADKSGGESVLYADLPGAPPGTWPFAGLEFVDGVPDEAILPTSFVDRGISEGWIVPEGHRLVTRPAGRPEAPWQPTATASVPHVFHHYDALVFKTVDGDVRFSVTHQPDKYADYAEATYSDRVEEFDGDDDTPVTDEIYAAGATRVDHFYRIAREG